MGIQHVTNCGDPWPMYTQSTWAPENWSDATARSHLKSNVRTSSTPSSACTAARIPEPSSTASMEGLCVSSFLPSTNGTQPAAQPSSSTASDSGRSAASTPPRAAKSSSTCRFASSTFFRSSARGRKTYPSVSKLARSRCRSPASNASAEERSGWRPQLSPSPNWAVLSPGPKRTVRAPLPPPPPPPLSPPARPPLLPLLQSQVAPRPARLSAATQPWLFGAAGSAIAAAESSCTAASGCR